MDLAEEKHRKKRKCKMEDDRERSGIECLPHDVTLDILSSLPVTSLMQFRFVSRGWNLLSYDPNLIDLHFSRTARNNPYLIFHCDYPIKNYLCFVELSDQLENEVVRKIKTHFCNHMPEFNVIASYNGLLCLYDSLYKTSIFIYNPFTSEHKELPTTKQYDDQEVLLGCGFSPVANEYKVVKIVYYWNHYRVEYGFSRRRRLRTNLHTGSEVQVYSFDSTGWRSIGEVRYELEWRSSEALVNGRLHWLTQPRVCREESRFYHCRNIVSFDLGEEKFDEVPRPDCGGLNKLNYHLVALGECLSAMVYIYQERFEIWVMEEYNVKEPWIKKFVIQDYSRQFIKQELRQSHRIWKNVLKQRDARFICLLKNGHILIEFKGGVLVSHDPNSGYFKQLVLQGLPNLFQTVVHIGSLNYIDNPSLEITN